MSAHPHCRVSRRQRFEYLTAVLRNERAVAKNPTDWLSWTYRATIAHTAEQRDGLGACG